LWPNFTIGFKYFQGFIGKIGGSTRKHVRVVSEILLRSWEGGVPMLDKQRVKEMTDAELEAHAYYAEQQKLSLDEVGLVRAEIKRREQDFQAAQAEKQLKIAKRGTQIAKRGVQATWVAAGVALIRMVWLIVSQLLHHP
jgi:hypothetical protein